jgi:regulator of cell morphogenesis and NO signaling
MSLALRTVGDLVTEDYRRAGVFKQFGIDFCCGGGISLEAACLKKGIAVADVERALAVADSRTASLPDRADAWDPDFLAAYIVNQHHSYVRESIPVLRAFTQKVARVHGGHQPRLVEIARLFEEVAVELEAHMVAEEQALFPRIRALVNGESSDASLRDLIDHMEHDHDLAGRYLREIRRLTDDYTPPEGACNTYRATFVKLEEFEDDLHRHVHLENNVLFPKVLALQPAEA